MITGGFLRRAILTLFSALVAAAALVVFFAWLALHVDWQLPDLTEVHGPTVVRADDGTLLARLSAEVDRRPVPLDQVSDVAIDAVVAAEDTRFFEHRGVDPLALLRAVITNVRTGAVEQGGSTLTQQYVKNVFTSGQRTLVRKVREAVLSIQLEREFTKDEILERYLNTVYFGEGAQGIEAAARTYFGVSAAELDAPQSAALAQLLPAPSRRNPRVDPDGARARRDRILGTMGVLGSLSTDEVEAATAAPLEVLPPERPTSLAPYFTAYVRRQLVAAYGEESVLTGGLEVTTTLDLQAQAQVEDAVKTNLPTLETGVEAGVAVVEPSTGQVTALYGGYDFYGNTANYSATNYAQVNLATDGQRQPGSTFKPFVLIAALEDGMELGDRYDAPARVTIGDWSPANFDRRGHGRLRLDQALVGSVNTVFAQLGADVGPEAIADVAARLGVRNAIAPEITIAIGATALGPSVLDMASAYATLANDGLHCPARTVLEVRGPDGRPLPPPPERVPPVELLEQRPEPLKGEDRDGCFQTVDRELARTVTAVMEDVVSSGTGGRARIGRPQAGKTGTTDDLRDAWFVGFVPQLSLAVWVGDPDEDRSLTDVGGFSRVFGGTLPAVIWRDAATALLDGIPPVEFAEPGEGDRDERRPQPGPTQASPQPGPTSAPAPSGPDPTGGPGDDGDDGDGGTGGGPDEPRGSPSPEGSEPDASPSPSPSPSPTESDGGGGGPCVPPIIDCD